MDKILQNLIIIGLYLIQIIQEQLKILKYHYLIHIIQNQMEVILIIHTIKFMFQQSLEIVG